ncbi:MAG: hypothetical protein ACOCZ8_04640, partial [Bacteroidota bacterium]
MRTLLSPALLFLTALLMTSWAFAQQGVVIGDATATPQATLDVRGDARIGTAPADNAQTNFLMRDPATGAVTTLDPSAFPNATGALTWDGTAWTFQPDQNTVYTEGTGITITPGNVIENDDPGSALNLAGSQGVTVGGTYPNLTIGLPLGSSTNDVLKWDGANWVPGADANTEYTAGNGIVITPGNVIENDDPGSAINMSGGNGITIGGTYPNLSLDLPAGTTLNNVLVWDDATSTWVASPVPGDDWGTQVVETDGTLAGDGTTANPLTIAPQGATSGQVLKWNGTTWQPDNDEGDTYTAGAGINITTGNVIENTLNLTAGTDIDITGTFPNLTISNTAPDETVVLNNGTGIDVTG